MDLLLKDKDLAQLLSDMQSPSGETLTLKWEVTGSDQGEWYSVYLTSSQVRRLGKVIPRVSIRERYHSK